MAAEGDQIAAAAHIAAPRDAPDRAPDPPADTTSFSDGEVPIESAAAAGRAAAGEVLQGGREPQGGSPSPVEDGDAKDGEEAREEREGEGGEEAEDAGRGCCGGGGSKRGERKGALFLPDAKRRKASPAALDKLPTPPAAEEQAAAGGAGPGFDGSGGGEPSSSSPPPFSFSFSFDTRGFGAAPIETTPKFGSFNFAALSDAGPAAAAGSCDEARGPDAEGGDV